MTELCQEKNLVATPVTNPSTGVGVGVGEGGWGLMNLTLAWLPVLPQEHRKVNKTTELRVQASDGIVFMPRSKRWTGSNCMQIYTSQYSELVTYFNENKTVSLHSIPVFAPKE